MKLHRVKAAMLAGACALSAASWAQVPSGSISSADVSEWSSFVPPMAAPTRSGPLPDEAFALVKQGGPWGAAEVAAIGPAERKLLALVKDRKWVDAMAWLKEANPDVNVREPVTGVTALSMASLHGQLDLVRELMRRGAELDRVGAGGWTPLGAAAFHGHELVARDLIRKGARLDAPGATGQLPLHLACATGQTRLIHMFIEQGADWREPNRQGRHALAEAALFGQIAAMQALVRHGAAYDVLDLHGLNAVHAAALGEQKETLAFLAQHKVPVPSPLTAVLIDQVVNPLPGMNTTQP